MRRWAKASMREGSSDQDSTKVREGLGAEGFWAASASMAAVRARR